MKRRSAGLAATSRYHEKLATPDVTMADLIGDIDLVRHAEGRPLSDEGVLHFGLVPRSNRGIFVINELPDLAPRIQVGLFNVLEERDVQIRGFPIRLNLDVMLAFSANPEDYTNRGRIVTPLKDRIGTIVRTHYPFSNAEAMRITRDNARLSRPEGSPQVELPAFVHETVEEMVRQRFPARTSTSNPACRCARRSPRSKLSSPTPSNARSASMSRRSCRASATSTACPPPAAARSN